MKDKHVTNFWIGFIVSTIAVAWLYWLWKRYREATPEPLIIDRVIKERLKIAQETRPDAEPDALEEIRGIGPVFAKRLNEAGILTFTQLAESEPIELREIVGSTPWDTAEWIEEARLRSTKSQAH